MSQPERYWLVAVPGVSSGSRGVRKVMGRITDSVHVKGKRLAGSSKWVGGFVARTAHACGRFRSCLDCNLRWVCFCLFGADLSYFKIPALKVGTLDALMQLSDDLNRIDAFIEGVVRKIERQYSESDASITEHKADEGEVRGGLVVHGSECWQQSAACLLLRFTHARVLGMLWQGLCRSTWLSSSGTPSATITQMQLP